MDRPYLIMIPGWGMDSDIWGGFSEKLSDRFEILYIDWSGLDRLDSFKNRIAEAICRAESSRVFMLGWSLGAEAALEFALDNPEKVEKLVLISATARFTQDRKSGYRIGWSKRAVEKMKQNLEHSGSETIEEFRKNLFSEGEAESGMAKSLMEKLEKRELQDTESLRLGLDYLIETDIRDKLKSLNVSTLLIHGSEDKIVPCESSEYIETIAKNQTEVKILEGCGHIPFYTEAEGCLKYMNEFLVEGRKYDR